MAAEGENRHKHACSPPFPESDHLSLKDPHQPAPKRARVDQECGYTKEIADLNQQSEEFATPGEGQWLDSDERTILEMMASLEQAIRKFNQQQQQHVVASCASQPANTSTSCVEVCAPEGEKQLEEYPQSDQSERKLNFRGDGTALAVIDEEAEQFLQEAENQNILLQLCGSWDKSSSPRRDCAVDVLELDTLQCEDELGAVYSPLLDNNVQGACEI